MRQKMKRKSHFLYILQKRLSMRIFSCLLRQTIAGFLLSFCKVRLFCETLRRVSWLQQENPDEGHPALCGWVETQSIVTLRIGHQDLFHYSSSPATAVHVKAAAARNEDGKSMVAQSKCSLACGPEGNTRSRSQLLGIFFKTTFITFMGLF